MTIAKRTIILYLPYFARGRPRRLREDNVQGTNPPEEHYLRGGCSRKTMMMCTLVISSLFSFVR